MGAEAAVGQGPALRGLQGRARTARATARRCPRTRSAQGYQDVEDPSVYVALPGHQAAPARCARATSCSCGRRRRGRSSPTPPSPSTRSSTYVRTARRARCWPRRSSRACSARTPRSPTASRGARHGRRRLRAAVPVHPGVRVRREGPHRPARPTSSPPRTAPASSTPRSRSARTTSGSAPSRASNVVNPVAARRHLRRAHRPVRRALRQGRRQRPDRGPARARAAASAPSACCTPTRTAGAAARRCSTTPSRPGTSARRRCKRPAAGGQRDRRLASGAHQARALRHAGWRTTSTGRCRASATGARRCRSGATRRARRVAIGSFAELEELSRRRARRPAPPVRGRRRDPVADRRRAAAPRARGDRRLVRLGLDAVRPVARAVREPGQVRRAVPGRLHLRGDRPDARLVLLADRDLARCCSTRAPYRTVLCLGHIADPEGKKMSKSLGNIVVPWDVIDRHGADAFRWYFLTTKQPWDGYLFDADTVGESLRQFLLQLWNTYGFYVLYANVNDVEPADGAPARPTSTAGRSRGCRDRRDGRRAPGRLRRHPRRPGDRRVRRRPLELVRAPLAPALLGRRPGRVRDAAHAAWSASRSCSRRSARSSPTRSTTTSTAPSRASTCATWPEAGDARRASSSSRWRSCARPCGSASPRAGRRSSRSASRCARRSWWPPAASARRSSASRDVVLEELNVKELRYVSQADELGSYEVKPNYRALGPRFGKHMPQVAAAVAALDPRTSPTRCATAAASASTSTATTTSSAPTT